ncbi:hypothetical protein TNCV_4778361 [Trichonephila clavipes]|nr:hypothetical protein TNCV_4778361 [Trichonephila clavipes]
MNTCLSYKAVRNLNPHLKTWEKGKKYWPYSKSVIHQISVSSKLTIEDAPVPTTVQSFVPSSMGNAIHTVFCPRRTNIFVGNKPDGAGCRSVLLPIRNYRKRKRSPPKGFQERDEKVTRDRSGRTPGEGYDAARLRLYCALDISIRGYMVKRKKSMFHSEKVPQTNSH